MTDGNDSRMPVIGLSCSLIGDRYSVPQGYINSVRASGGYPEILPLPQDKAEAEALLSGCGGLLLTGGVDVEPALYGSYRQFDTEEICAVRDRGEFALLDAAVKSKLPILGICRGIQIINVYFGGTLYQDIPSQIRSLPCGGNPHRQSLPFPEGGHFVTFEEEIWPIPDKKIRVNSYHHQAVRRVAPGFRVIARDDEDGLVEAIYAPENDRHGPVAAVQWHPELLQHIRPEHKAIFEYFIGLARRQR